MENNFIKAILNGLQPKFIITFLNFLIYDKIIHIIIYLINITINCKYEYIFNISNFKFI